MLRLKVIQTPCHHSHLTHHETQSLQSSSAFSPRSIAPEFENIWAFSSRETSAYIIPWAIVPVHWTCCSARKSRAEYRHGRKLFWALYK